MKNTTIEACRDAMLYFRMDYHGYRGNNYPTKFNDFYISGITCQVVEKISYKIISVPEEPIMRVYLSDITVEKAGEKSVLLHADDILFSNVQIEGEEIKTNKLKK